MKRGRISVATRRTVIMWLLILSPAFDALKSYLMASSTMAGAIGSAITGCTAAAIALFMNPPRIQEDTGDLFPPQPSGPPSP